MAFITDYSQLNAANDYQNWTYSNWSPTDNGVSSNTPIYIEGSSCQWWPLSKGVTDGYVYAAVTGNMNNGKILVWYWNMAIADIYNIPLTNMRIRICSTSWTSNCSEWDAKIQVPTPYNVPISGHVPLMVYPTNPDTVVNGTLDETSLSHVGLIGTTGGTADGKQGGFDMVFIIGYIGLHSETHTDTFFDELYEQSYDDQGATSLPVNADRPLGVISRAGDFFQSNVKFQLGLAGATANTVIDETGKTIFFSNVEPEHELGYVFVNPTSYEVRFTLTDCVHFWTSQQSTHEIFTDATYADYFKITGCAFTNGGKITLPPDNVNRWVRNTKFSNCQTGTASDGDFTDNILNGCYAMTISGDADFSGTQILAPAVAIDTSGLVWNGNYDPNGNLDGMVFTKGSNAHHAIEFGTASPLTMTLTNITVSGFNAVDAQNDSTLHIKRTSGTVTINLSGCTGDFSYKSAGATVNIVSGAVTVKATAKTATGTAIQNAEIFLKASDGTGPFPFEESVTITRSGTTATVTHTAHGMASNDKIIIKGITDKEEDNSGVKQITVVNANSYTYTTTNSGSTSYTGTIISTFVALSGTTDINGEISTSRVYASNQPVVGWARKSTGSPLYDEGPLTGTVDSTTGYNQTGVLVSDE